MYIHELAERWSSKNYLNLSTADLGPDPENGLSFLYERIAEAVRKRVKETKPEILGKLIDCAGVGTYCAVKSVPLNAVRGTQSYVGCHPDGRNAQHDLATVAMVAAIYDVLLDLYLGFKSLNEFSRSQGKR